MKYFLKDAFTENKLHPDTFQIPSPEAIASLAVGDLIQIGLEAPEGVIWKTRLPLNHGMFKAISATGERIWVEIIAIEGEKIHAEVQQADMLFHAFHGVKHAASISFERNNILKVHKEFFND